MNVLVNGESKSFDVGELSVNGLLERLGLLAPKGVAVAKNYTVIPRSRWESESVSDGDEIEIVRATQGG